MNQNTETICKPLNSNRFVLDRSGYDSRFSSRTAPIQDSAIRDFLSASLQPDVISFAAGFPSPDLFPRDGIAAAAASVLESRPLEALQYGQTEGVLELRQWVATWLNRDGVRYDQNDIVVVSGSQQALDLMARIFIDRGDTIVVEQPTYLGAMQAFNAYDPQYAIVESDDYGIIPEALEYLFRRSVDKPKLLYVVPNFSNPTGRSLAADRRRVIVELCKAFSVVILEDDPYRDLRFDGTDHPALSSYDDSGIVVYCGSASKLVSPGLRIAWLASTNPRIRDNIVLAKQGTDLQTGTFAQHLFYSYVSNRQEFARHMNELRTAYRRRRDAMLDAIDRYARCACHVRVPQGGLFLWLRCPGVDTRSLLSIALAENVLFLPGAAFYATDAPSEAMRLSFSCAAENRNF